MLDYFAAEGKPGIVCNGLPPVLADLSERRGKFVDLETVERLDGAEHLDVLRAGDDIHGCARTAVPGRCRAGHTDEDGHAGISDSAPV